MATSVMTSFPHGVLRAVQDLIALPAVRWPRRYRRIKLILLGLLVINACLYAFIFVGRKEVVGDGGERNRMSLQQRDVGGVSVRGLRQKMECAVTNNTEEIVKEVLRNRESGGVVLKEHGGRTLCANVTVERTPANDKAPTAPRKNFFGQFLHWFQFKSDDSTNITRRKSLTASHDYNLVINQPDVCRTNGENPRSVFLLVCVFTIHANFEKRQAIRDTWGSQKLLGDKRIITIFMLGKSNDSFHQKLVELESKKYGDIIMEDFVDTYYNLTLKTIMTMKWVSQYCGDANYVMKTDDDMFVNYDTLIALLKNPRTPKADYFVGSKFSANAPIRNPKSKWYVPRKMYPKSRYPSFCSGTGYVMSGDIPARAYNMSLHTRYLYLEDVYMGICLKKLHIKMANHPGFHIFNEPYRYCAYKRLITSHGKTATEMYRIWEDQRSQVQTTCVNIKTG